MNKYRWFEGDEGWDYLNDDNELVGKILKGAKHSGLIVHKGLVLGYRQQDTFEEARQWVEDNVGGWI